MPPGVEVVLSSTVAGGKGQENGPAIRRGRLYPAKREQVLDPKLGPGPEQAEGYRAGGCLEVTCQPGVVLPLDLPGDKDGALGGRESAQRLANGPAFFVGLGGILGPLGLGEVGHAWPQTLTAVFGAVLRDDEVLGRHDGVGHQGSALQRPPGLKDASERLLDQIIDEVRVGHPGSDDAAHHRLHHGDVGNGDLWS